VPVNGVKGYHRSLRRLLIPIVVLIVYGSLYPWRFVPAHLAANPLWLLVHSWDTQPLRYLLRDAIVNVALYIPLGFAARMAFRNTRLPGFALYGPVLLGLLLSAAVEIIQLFEPTRHSSIVDVITNVTGTVIGVIAGLLFEDLSSPGDFRKPRRIGGSTRADQGALLLAFCWVAWIFFPLYPVISRSDLSHKLAFFAHARVVDPVSLLSTAASWYAGGLLLTAAGMRFSRGWFGLTLLAIPIQFLIVDRQPLPSGVVGAIAGAVLFALCHRARTPTKTEAWIFLGVILVRGLSPFHLAPAAAEFDWTPFVATLLGEWQSAAGVLIEKVFYYGTAIWLLRAAGLKWVPSTIVAAAVLASIEIAQIRLPGRTPEITDPVLAILLGFVLALLSRSGRSVRNGSEP
jgi:VanZ family protein